MEQPSSTSSTSTSGGQPNPSVDSPTTTTQTNSNSKAVTDLDATVKRVSFYKNPFDVLDVPPGSTVEELQKAYKKLALQLHPDKCKHPKAQDAFNALNRANKILQETEIRDRYAQISQDMRNKLDDEQKEKGAKGEKVLKGPQFEYALKMRTHKYLMDLEEYNKTAEKYRVANEKREQDEEKKKFEEFRSREQKEKEWEEGRMERVEGWRQFLTKKGGAGTATKKKRKPVSELKPPKLKQQQR